MVSQITHTTATSRVPGPCLAGHITPTAEPPHPPEQGPAQPPHSPALHPSIHPGCSCPSEPGRCPVPPSAQSPSVPSPAGLPQSRLMPTLFAPLLPPCPRPERRSIPRAAGAGQTPPLAPPRRSPDPPPSPAQPLPIALIPGFGAGSARHGPAPPGTARLRTARHGSAGLARLGRFGSATRSPAGSAPGAAPLPSPFPGGR